MKTDNITNAIKAGEELTISIIVGNFRSVQLSGAGKVVSQKRHVVDSLIDLEEQLSFEKDTSANLTNIPLIDQLDKCLIPDSMCKAVFKDGKIVFTLSSVRLVDIPKEIMEKVMETGTSEYWTERGYKYMAISTNSHDGVGARKVYFECCNNKSGHSIDHLMYNFTQTGQGDDLLGAIAAMFEAPIVEEN